MEKLGLNGTQFSVNTSSLQVLPNYHRIGDAVLKSDRVIYMDTKCIVMSEPLVVGDHREVLLQIHTNNPKKYIPVYNASDIHFLSPIGLDLTPPKFHYKYGGSVPRLSEKEMLQEKYSNLDLPKNFVLEELKELDEWIESLRYIEI